MRWSWRIGTIAGIDIYVHPTFLLLLAWVALAHFFAHRDPREALSGLAFIIALFAIVVLHELGHALAAKLYGIRTRDITLLPIGGVARLERIPEEPGQELVVAVAGPAVNVVLATAIFLGLFVAQGLSLSSPQEVLSIGGSLPRLSLTHFVHQLYWVNVMLVAFNMVPAFPMDGGRVFRALLAMRLDYVRATQIAAAVGHGIALLFGIMGLFFNPLLIFIALFVWLGGSQEAGFVLIRSALGDVPVMRAMITDFRVLRPDDCLSKGVEYLLSGFQQDFPVVEDGRVVGVLTLSDLAAALGSKGSETTVGNVMQSEFATAHPQETLQTVFARLQEGHCRTIPVLKDSRLEGLMTADHLAEVMMIRQALHEARRPGLNPSPRLLGSASVRSNELSAEAAP